ncbi:MAG: L,D-transpeptidase family protein [Vicinamibacterales bacterium]
MARAALFVVAALAVCPGGHAIAQEVAAREVLTGGVGEYVVQRGDTLASVSARFGTGTDTLRERNGLDPRARLAIGQTLTVDNRHIAGLDPGASITINVAQRMLYLADGESVRAFPVAVGQKSWPTPVGAFMVVDKEENPTWDVPVSIQREMLNQGKKVITRMPPSPENPLGAYWIRLSIENLGIHGTIAPASIYRYASHGCIRMHPDDIAQVYARVGPGAVGRLTYQPVLVAEIDGQVFVEAHADVYRLAPDPAAYVRNYADMRGLTERIDWQAVAAVLQQPRGLAIDVTKQ